MGNKQYKYSKLTGQVIGSSMKIHSKLGCGFQDVVYQRCLEIEFRRNNLRYAREASMKIFYDDFEVGTRRIDFLIEDKVLLEIKAQTELNDIHYAQIINYLEAFRLEVELLISFCAKSFINL